MRNAVAFSNNDVITIAWSYGKRPDGCMGFAIYRIDDKGAESPLPSHAVFPGQTIKPGQTTEDFPIQKFYWKDVYARPIAEKTGNFTFSYKIVPLQGKPGKLTPMSSLPYLITNKATLTPECSPSLSATFNRGLISTQHVSGALNKIPTKAALIKKITNVKDPLRQQLSGEMIDTLTGFLKRTDKGGEIYAALYELTDIELISSLACLGKKLHIVLADIKERPPSPKSPNKKALTGLLETSSKAAASSSGVLKGGKGKTKPAAQIEENQDARTKLSASAKEFLYRLPPSSHIVHNKFLIYVKGAKPVAVLTGSTNWTATGLCAQTNNALVIDDPDVAQRYMNYWNVLKADQLAHQKNPKTFQGPPMRGFDGKPVPPFVLHSKASSSGTTPSELTSYFSPNTPKQRSKKKGSTEVKPIDMKELESRVTAAKHAVLFLAFIPGTPSIVNFAGQAQRANKDLFVRGCVTAPAAAGTFYYTLHGTSPPKQQGPAKGQPKAPKKPIPQNPDVIAAAALTKGNAPTGWSQELLKAGFAITHDKIVVIDPFDDDCTVVTGSHNLGYQASYNNDENLAIIKGNKKLAMAYATHVLDVYDHFAWRWSIQRGQKTVDANLKTTPDQWLQWYFDSNGNIKTAQLKFWMQATT